MNNLLEVRQLSKRYKGSPFTLQEVSFTLPPGSITGFIGGNGAGKTTTMGAILGTVQRDGGSIRVFGREMDPKGPDRHMKERIGVVFDQMHLSGRVNAMELSQVLRCIYRNWDQAAYVSYLDAFSLPRKEKAGGFSRGMSMKLSLAAALSHRADLLILDEATAGLDPVSRETVLDVLQEYVRNKERAILLSSHITGDIEKIADRLLLMKEGKVALEMGKQELMEAQRASRASGLKAQTGHSLEDLALSFMKGETQ